MLTRKKLKKEINDINSKVNELKANMDNLEKQINSVMMSINNHQLIITKLIAQASETNKARKPIAEEIKVVDTKKKDLSRNKSAVLSAKDLDFVSVSHSRPERAGYYQTRICGHLLYRFAGKRMSTTRSGDKLIIAQDEKNGAKIHKISLTSGKLFTAKNKTGDIAEGYHKAEYKDGKVIVYTKIMYDDNGNEVHI